MPLGTKRIFGKSSLVEWEIFFKTPWQYLVLESKCTCKYHFDPDRRIQLEFSWILLKAFAWFCWVRSADLKAVIHDSQMYELAFAEHTVILLLLIHWTDSETPQIALWCWVSTYSQVWSGTDDVGCLKCHWVWNHLLETTLGRQTLLRALVSSSVKGEANI